MRVVLAPDSFKGTLGAAEVAAALAAGWRGVHPGDEVSLLPMADGGEGTLDAIRAARPDASWMPVTVDGPDGRRHETAWLLLPGGVGVVELAAASGLTLLARPAPLDAHTLGFGQAIADALRHGVRRLLLAIGGSASTDGGTGMLRALGARFLAADGSEAPLGGRGLGRLAGIDVTGLAVLPPGGVTVLSDVTNPLCGPDGAAAVYGAQKGADAAERARLDAGLTRLAGLVRRDLIGRGLDGRGLDGRGLDGHGLGGQDLAGQPGAGAAGGTGFGLLVWGRLAGQAAARPGAPGQEPRLTLESGARAVAHVVGLPAAAAGADIVVTGEGRYDGQSAAGKVPSFVASLPAGGRRFLVAGEITAAAAGFDAAVSLTELAGSGAAARGQAARWLQRAGAVLAARAHEAN